MGWTQINETVAVVLTFVVLDQKAGRRADHGIGLFDQTPIIRQGIESLDVSLFNGCHQLQEPVAIEFPSSGGGGVGIGAAIEVSHWD
jgi:hypothetical protein